MFILGSLVLPSITINGTFLPTKLMRSSFVENLSSCISPTVDPFPRVPGSHLPSRGRDKRQVGRTER